MVPNFPPIHLRMRLELINACRYIVSPSSKGTNHFFNRVTRFLTGLPVTFGSFRWFLLTMSSEMVIYWIVPFCNH